MRAEVFQRLLSINEEFYQSFGHAFAQTRRRVQPGVLRVLEEWITDGDWLDLGCGNGALAQAWRETGLRGSYTGVDFSIPLLEEARETNAPKGNREDLSITFAQVDVTAEDWNAGLPLTAYDGAVSFAVLHHIPSAALRQRLVASVACLLRPGGMLTLSVWQFQHSPKLLARVQPWSKVGLGEEEVESGDTLLDWRHHSGGVGEKPGLRYVHLFTRDELGDLACKAGFDVVSEFESDGSGGQLGLYQVWRLPTS